MSNDIKHQFDMEYEKYILPYYKEVGFFDEPTNIVNKNFEIYKQTFVEKKVELVYYSRLDWVNDYKYVKSKGYDLDNGNFKYLASTDISLYKALVEPECQRRVRQITELCCDLMFNSVAVYPVSIGLVRSHPGTTLLHSLKILDNPCKVIRVVDQDFEDYGEIIDRFYCLDEIQDYYNNPIIAYFVSKEKCTGLQIVSKHRNWGHFDMNGNLGWESDKKNWPFEKFLIEFQNKTNNMEGETINFVYNDKLFELCIPFNPGNVLNELYIWGYENCRL